MRPVHCAALLSAVLVLPVLAKLPPQTDEAKAAAAQAAARTAWSDKVGTYQLCLAQDRVAERYRKSGKAAATSTPAPMAAPAATAAPASGAAAAPVAIPACADPGPYVAAVTPPAKPLEAAGAHSPAATAVGPPSTKATAAEIAPKK